MLLILYLISKEARYLLQCLKDNCNKQGLIRYDLEVLNLIYDPFVTLDINLFKELKKYGLISIGKKSNSKNYYIRIFPYCGEYPNNVNFMASHKQDLPWEFIQNKQFRPSQFNNIKSEINISDIEKQIKVLFEYWQKITERTDSLTRKRKSDLFKALKKYKYDKIAYAIKGVVEFPFFMGENNENRIYNDLHTIIKNIEDFSIKGKE